MAAALSALPDLSSSPQHDSNSNSLTNPDFTLGSLTSAFSTPLRTAGRRPSATSRTTATSSLPVQTPSPGGPSASNYVSSRKNGNVTHLDEGFDDYDGNETAGGDLLRTPAAATADKQPLKTRGRSGTLTSGTATNATASNNKLSKLTLRDQEKHIDNLKKENFSIKLRVHFLEDQLARLAPDQMEAALKQNINLKIEVQQRGMEIKKLKKLLLSLERELERLQRGAGSSIGASARERELEQRLEEKERELEELRRRRVEREEDDDELLRAAEGRNAELEDELENVKALLEDNMEEIDRLKDLLQRKGDTSVSSETSSSRTALQRRVEALDDENQDLQHKLVEQEDINGRLQDEKEDLLDAVNALELRIEEIQQRRHAESIERSESRAALLEEQEERENLEEEINRLRDRIAALQIELQGKEDEVEELIKEHRSIVETVEAEWRGELEEQRTQNEELKDAITEHESESKELRLHISELESNTNDLHAKFEGHIGQLEEELEERRRDIEDRDRELEERELELERRDVEIENLRGTIDKLGEQIYLLEDENDRFKEELDRIRDDEAAERVRLEGVVTALKEKNGALKDEIQELTTIYEQAKDDVQVHLARQEELARHVEDLVAELETERTERDQAEDKIANLIKDLEEQGRNSKRALDAKEMALQSALADLARAESRLRERESDLANLQAALQETERESKKLGESVTTTRFSLQLELDRFKRDLERTEDELTRLRSELAAKEAAYRDREAAIDKLHAENRELTTQLASQTQARLNMGEKLDAVQKEMKDREEELNTLRTRAAELESRLSKDQRALLQAEGLYRDQLTERNTLLLTIYQYLDKILGVDKTPKKGSSAETKPFTNFSVFHDNLITRLKQVSQIQLEFDKKAKAIEGRFTDRLGDMKKQLDTRWKQIDKFEASVKVFAETKAQWRKKLSTKEGELEALKATNSDLSSQLTSLKRPSTGDSMEIRSLATRANNAERRLNNAQNQLLAHEDKIMQLNQRNAVADEKWEARVKEYEARLRAAEEKVKRERQGSKERVGELENNVKSLQRQLEIAQKRTAQLNEVLETTKSASNGKQSRSSPNNS